MAQMTGSNTTIAGSVNLLGATPLPWIPGVIYNINPNQQYNSWTSKFATQNLAAAGFGVMYTGLGNQLNREIGAMIYQVGNYFAFGPHWIGEQ